MRGYECSRLRAQTFSDFTTAHARAKTPITEKVGGTDSQVLAVVNFKIQHIMDWLKDKIKQKEKELQGLKKQLEEKETEKYKHFIGRYFELAATTIFRVDKIEYITSDRIECEGLRITGDIRYSNDFSINIMGSGSLFIDYSNNEITKEKFIEIMNSWIDEQKKNVLAHLL